MTSLKKQRDWETGFTQITKNVFGLRLNLNLNGIGSASYENESLDDDEEERCAEKFLHLDDVATVTSNSTSSRSSEVQSGNNTDDHDGEEEVRAKHG